MSLQYLYHNHRIYRLEVNNELESFIKLEELLRLRIKQKMASPHQDISGQVQVSSQRG